MQAATHATAAAERTDASARRRHGVSRSTTTTCATAHASTDIREESNAVVLCIMDTSGLDGHDEEVSGAQLLLPALPVHLHQVPERRDRLHRPPHRGQEVTEEEFFHKGESGGTFISSGYTKALEIIQERYHPSLWNVYAFHCSDGDNSTPTTRRR